MQVATILGGWKMYSIALCIHIAAITTAIHEDGIHCIEVLLAKRGITKGTLKRSTTGIGLPDYQVSRLQDLAKLLKLRLEHDDFIKFQLFLAVFLSNSIELMIFLPEIVRVLYEDGQQAMSKRLCENMTRYISLR